jgi:hypothetical protein
MQIVLVGYTPRRAEAETGHSDEKEGRTAAVAVAVTGEEGRELAAELGVPFCEVGGGRSCRARRRPPSSGCTRPWAASWSTLARGGGWPTTAPSCSAAAVALHCTALLYCHDCSICCYCTAMSDAGVAKLELRCAGVASHPAGSAERGGREEGGLG